MGGFLTVSTTIHGTESAPGIAFDDSPTGGVYKTPDGGFGISLSGNKHLTLDSTGFTIGYRPPSVFGMSAIAGQPYADQYADYIALSPDNRFIYSPNGSNGALKTLHGYAVNIDGTLTPVPGSPYTVHALASHVGYPLISPNGKFLYLISNATSAAYDEIYAYSIDQATGALTPLVGSPFTYLGAATLVQGAVFNSDGTHMYICDNYNNLIRNFTMNTVTGVPALTTSTACATNGQGLSISRDGKFMSMNRTTAPYMEVFSINPANGSLTAVATYPTVKGVTEECARFNPAYDFLAIGSEDAGVNVIQIYSVAASGALNATGVPITGLTSISNIAWSPDGLKLFATDPSTGFVRAYSFDPSVASLTAIGTIAAVTPENVVISSDQQFMFTGNGNAATVGAYQLVTSISYDILAGNFDSSGGLNGTLTVNGKLILQNQVILSQNTADARYAALAGSVAQPFSAKSLTLDHAAGGIVGTPTNDSAAAGYVGEYMQTAVAVGAGVALTTGVAANIASVALTAGDWEVEGMVGYHSSGTTTVNDCTEGISAVSATLPAAPGEVHTDYLTIVVPAAPDPTYGAPRQRISLAAPATVYLVALSNFTVSTLTAYGQINARRVR